METVKWHSRRFSLHSCSDFIQLSLSRRSLRSSDYASQRRTLRDYKVFQWTPIASADISLCKDSTWRRSLWIARGVGQRQWRVGMLVYARTFDFEEKFLGITCQCTFSSNRHTYLFRQNIDPLAEEAFSFLFSNRHIRSVKHAYDGLNCSCYRSISIVTAAVVVVVVTDGTSTPDITTFLILSASLAHIYEALRQAFPADLAYCILPMHCATRIPSNV